MGSINLKDQWKIWARVALNSFGGPAGQIAVIHRVVVEEKKIVSEEEFLHALNFCMLLPGPEAHQLATYMGWLMNRWKGGLLAGGLFILPGFLSILLLSYLYVMYSELPLVQGLFYGMKPAIIAIVSYALLKIARKSLQHFVHWVLAALAFVALFFFQLPFPLVVLGSALVGVLVGKFVLHHEFHPASVPGQVPLPPLTGTLKTFLIWAGVWFAPVIPLIILFGQDSIFVSQSILFSKMSMVTFGGAYAALSYMAQKAVEVLGWLQGPEMLDGLGMAETTPGPLIQVVQFIGFMGAYRFPEGLSPYASALIGSLVSTWMTFAPCFLWIFVGAPYVEYVRTIRILTDAFKAITSSIVGVIFNLSLWFALKALFTESHQVQGEWLHFEYPVWETLDIKAALICLVALILQFHFKRGTMTVLGVSVLLGMALRKFL